MGRKGTALFAGKSRACYNPVCGAPPAGQHRYSVKAGALWRVTRLYAFLNAVHSLGYFRPAALTMASTTLKIAHTATTVCGSMGDTSFRRMPSGRRVKHRGRILPQPRPWRFRVSVQSRKSTSETPFCLRKLPLSQSRRDPLGRPTKMRFSGRRMSSTPPLPRPTAPTASPTRAPRSTCTSKASRPS